MNDANQPIRLKARWDHHEVPTGVENQRGLLLEIEADERVTAETKERPPLELQRFLIWMKKVS